jgi:protein-arginine kinase activator protein McsA
MSHTFEELKKKTIDELREIARGLDHEAVHGFTQMNKEHLLPAVCKALGIDSHVHHHAATGFDKSSVKARIRRLKADREKALEARDHGQLKQVRRQIHNLKRRIRAATL